MKHSRIFKRRWLFATVVATALLAACGGGVDSDDKDDHGTIFIDTSGRLALTEQNSNTLRIHDLDSGNVEASHVLANVPSAVYASPGGRYAVVPQRTNDLVQFFDGGVWQEDHGDHLHDYKQASKPMSYTLVGARPTHYDVQAGVQAAFFMDGNASATPVQNAGVRLFTDNSIAAGNTAASLALSLPIHGLGEPVGNKLLTVARANDAPDTLPTHLTLYQRNGSGYSFDRQLPARCNGMHGSFSSGSSTLVGCSDGMLLVKHLSASTVSDGQILSTPLRVGTIAGHPRLPNHFIGIATDGVAPATVTTRFYAVNGETAAVSNLTPEGWVNGRVRRAHGFDSSGQRFFIIDDLGTLTVSQRQGTGWVNLARVTGAIPTMPTAAPWPAIAANGAKNEVYITDPVAKQLITVNSTNGAVVTRRSLGYTPAALAWLGITR
ncbi:MAG: hypothetical protein ACKO1L_03780 [Brachymonas sp.]